MGPPLCAYPGTGRLDNRHASLQLIAVRSSIALPSLPVPFVYETFSIQFWGPLTRALRVADITAPGYNLCTLDGAWGADCVSFVCRSAAGAVALAPISERRSGSFARYVDAALR